MFALDFYSQNLNVRVSIYKESRFPTVFVTRHGVMSVDTVVILHPQRKKIRIRICQQKDKQTS